MRARRAVRLVEPGRDGLTWWCRPFGSDADTPVAIELVPDGAVPGSTWIAEVSVFDDGSIVVVRLAEPFADHGDEALEWEREGGDGIDDAGQPARGRRAPSPRARMRSDRLARGTVISAHIEFSGTPGHRDGNLQGKYRPCVVIADHGHVLDVQPLFTSGGAAGRDGHPVVDWHAAGLTRATVLGPRTVRIAPDDLGSLIGSLSARDLPKVNPPRR